MGKTIAVGLDASPGSAEAMRWALRVARRAGASVKPVYAWDYPTLALLPFPAGLPVPPQEAMQVDAEARAGRLLSRPECWGDPDDEHAIDPDAVEVLDPVVRQGNAGRVLCDESSGDDLLVLGSRGLGLLKGAILGSVSAYCARAASCPVAVIPEGGSAPRGKGNVVVGVDGSPLSRAAIEFADEWAPEETLVRLVHAWDLTPAINSAMGSIDIEGIEEAVAHVLDEAANSVKRHKVETLSIRGDARIELERLAGDADALIVGARGHSMIERFLLGSVATHTVHHVSAPTIIVGEAHDEPLEE